jgi:two-component system chemotaxis response regulator CheY
MVALGIVDDEPDIRKLFNIVLRRNGYPVAYMASNGVEAVELNRTNPADVVFMDYIMPLKNGIDAAKEILSEHPQTKVFLMTCGEDLEGHMDGLRNVTVIKKPFPFKSIITMLKR